VRIDSLAFGGDGVGRDESGRVVFVAGGAAPGDLVEVQLVEEKRRFARAQLLTVVEAGSSRVTPPCPLADRCGGCPWMQVAPDEQRRQKQEIVRRALEPLGRPSGTGSHSAQGGPGIEVRQIAAPAGELGYRVRARMTARGGKLGFAARRSHEIVDVETCPALEPALDAALRRARASLKLREEGTLAGLVAADGRVHLAVTGLAEGDARALVGEAGIAGIAVENRSFGARELDLGEGLRGAAGGFQQANRAQNDVLRALVREAVAAARPSKILELYAGAGNFTRDLLPLAAEGVAVEGDREAAARLASLVAGNPGWRVVRARAEDGLTPADVVVLDPPRAGAADVIRKIAAGRVVYVSCDPMTLARDLKILVEKGYAGWAQPVEMMPQTAHIEVVSVVDRVSDGR
jgi:23S rRNA (uracil1939-C5)-methyltransferase